MNADKERKYGEGWELLTASSRTIVQGRWQTFWNYVIRGKVPEYTLSAWVHPLEGGENKIGEILLYCNWEKPQNG